MAFKAERSRVEVVRLLSITALCSRWLSLEARRNDTHCRPCRRATTITGRIASCRMKTLARRYIWWPGIDRDIDRLVRDCEPCSRHQRTPPAAPLHPWEFPAHPWLRLHLDFAGPFQKHMWFILVDAHSKWPEVVMLPIGATTTSHTICLLRQMFSPFWHS